MANNFITNGFGIFRGYKSRKMASMWIQVAVILGLAGLYDLNGMFFGLTRTVYVLIALLVLSVYWIYANSI